MKAIECKGRVYFEAIDLSQLVRSYHAVQINHKFLRTLQPEG